MVWAARKFGTQLLSGCIQLTQPPQNVAGFVVQSRPLWLFCDRSTIFPQSFGQVSLLFEMSRCQLAYRSGIGCQTFQISKPLRGQIANNAAGLKLDFGIRLPCERPIDLRQRFRNTPEFDQGPGEVQTTQCVSRPSCQDTSQF